MFRTLTAALLLLFLALPAAAVEGVRVSAVIGGYGHSGKQILNGIRVDLDPGWHAYWKSPGEAGLPPTLDVEGQNASRSQILLPVPERFTSAGFEAVGYQSSFVIPILTDIVDPTLPTAVRVTGRVYACSEVCVPVEVDLPVTVPAGARNRAEIEELASWLSKSPGGGTSSIRILSSEAASDGDVIVRVATNPNATISVFLDVGTDGFGRLRSTERMENGVVESRFTVENYRDTPVDLSSARVVVSDGLSPPLEAPLDISHGVQWHILLIAFAGGVILNAMPCVFPVLAIKLLMVSTIQRGKVRSTLLVTSLGMLSTFLLMGITLAALKAAGHSVGWGLHFQQPFFLLGMAVLLLTFGTAMAGTFEILLPSRLATRLTSATNGDGAVKAFLQGAVLTVLATPCSAPFVGTAVGYALAKGAEEIIPVFLAMGLGMALPFLVLSAVPRLVSFVPRPGKWMDHAKNATAVAMFATAGWLMWLLNSTGSLVELRVVAFVAIVGVCASSLISRKTAVVMALALLLAPSIAAVTETFSPRSPIEWKRFDAAAVREHVADRKTVFINISADWCLTCKVNERTTLADAETAEVIANETVPMKGDWTQPNETIAAFLRSHGRFGIPFYMVVGPKAPEGIILPELVTSAEALSAIAKASGSNL